jgi:hypothetical protein
MTSTEAGSGRCAAIRPERRPWQAIISAVSRHPCGSRELTDCASEAAQPKPYENTPTTPPNAKPYALLARLHVSRHRDTRAMDQVHTERYRSARVTVLEIHAVVRNGTDTARPEDLTANAPRAPPLPCRRRPRPSGIYWTAVRRA